jgi:ketosteroid isomerase-like protein
MRRFFLLCTLMLTISPIITAEDAHVADHQALKQFINDITKALNERRYEDLNRYLNPECSLTFIDQGVVHNIEEIKAYFDKWLAPGTIYKNVQFAPKVDREAIFITPDTVFATGVSDDLYTFKDESPSATMPSRWTAVLAKRDGNWKLATLHVGISPSDNLVLTATKNAVGRTSLISGLVAGIVALICGLFIGTKIKRQKI